MMFGVLVGILLVIANNGPEYISVYAIFSKNAMTSKKSRNRDIGPCVGLSDRQGAGAGRNSPSINIDAKV